jgi:hypothetical protein
MTNPAAESGAFPRSERFIATGIAVVALAMRAVAFFHYRFDSDEPQHLHVTWGWATGLMQYRDVFDNHAPLFHMATAPLLRLLGERPDILLYMRAPMVILWVLLNFAAFTIALRLYGLRIATWSILLLNVFPPFFLKSLEFRTDNLWNACWMVGVLRLVDASPDPDQKPSRYIHLFLGGVMFGCALSVSLKTSLLLFSLVAASVLTWFARLRRHERSPIRPFDIALIVCGVPLIPAAIVAFFVSRGAWPRVVYCVFRFNELIAFTRPPLAIWGPRVLSIPALIILVRVAWRYRQNTTTSRFFLAATTAIFGVFLYCFWILISPRDFLPFMPFLAIFVVAALARRNHFAPIMSVIAFACLISIGYYTAWLKNKTREFITMERQVLTLTQPGEPLMDYKGETIYRRRPYYYVLEYITRKAIAQGLLPDTVPEDLVRTQCHVAQADGEQWPDRARAFMHENYINVGRLRVSGQIVHDGRITVAIPGDYVLLTPNGEARGTIDGTPYEGARHLSVGTHVIGVAAGEHVACVWAPAFARGFSPFHLRDVDF